MSRFFLSLSSLLAINISLTTYGFAQTQPTNPFLTDDAHQYNGHLCRAPSPDQKATLEWTLGGIRALPHHHWQRCAYSSPLNAMVWEDVSDEDVSKSLKETEKSDDNHTHDKQGGINDFTNIFKNDVGDKFKSIGGKKKTSHP